MNPHAYFEALAARSAVYAALPMSPLLVECGFSSAVAVNDNLHLDALLTSVVSAEILQGLPFPCGKEYVRVPAPLASLWCNANNAPLYASTDLVPTDETQTDSTYIHSRALPPTMSRENLETGKGRFKEKRTAVHLVTNRTFAALAYGNAAEVARLLNALSSIGFKHGVFGSVKYWRVTEIERFSLVDERGCALRPLPERWLYADAITLNSQAVGFSPPYWHASTRELCAVTGVEINTSEVAVQLEYR